MPFQLVKLLLTVLVFLTPVLGVWVASSLVAYSDTPASYSHHSHPDQPAPAHSHPFHN
ncbi:hypothetical protein J5X98_20825 [Leptothermofonsia sichuanensis E412]|uniref:hypothetical protein n=1 Tax=Leptothermofonsia sichuanensis TaxID=2917832 RepID=UPI001CA64520|nr:hypothetical protein [Leptothermofonsia sichuanensis]QZZ19740.1 hypothetical protein J5X98_20825 [Leptothermofonsia sichuanensis E412]